MRSRIVTKGYTEKIEDEDSVYASTPMFTTLRTLLALRMSRPNWLARLGDVSTACLHAPIAKDHDGKHYVYLSPLKNFAHHRTNYGGYRKPCMDYAAHLKRGRITATTVLGKKHRGLRQHCTLGLQDSYINYTVTAPGIAHYKPTIEDEALLNHEQHKRYRRVVGSLQWLAYTRPDICARPHSAYITKESQAPTTLPAQHQALQIHHRSNNNTKSKIQQHPGSRRSCRC